MQRSFLTNAARHIRNTARMLIALQTRAENLGSPYLDPAHLSDHMRRDLGLLDGDEARLEPNPRASTRSTEDAGTLTRLMMTPHAS